MTWKDLHWVKQEMWRKTANIVLGLWGAGGRVGHGQLYLGVVVVFGFVIKSQC